MSARGKGQRNRQSEPEKPDRGEKMAKKIEQITDLPGIGDTAAKKLTDAGYKSLEAIAVASPMELKEIAGLGDGTAEKAIKAARDALEMGFQTADILAEKRKQVGRLTTGSKELDALVGGGIETQSITEVYGKMASGKCISSDTPVLYFNPDTAHLKPIEQIYQNYATNEKKFDGGYVADLRKSISVIGIDLDGNIKLTEAKKLFKEKVNAITQIMTERGTELKLTKRHPLLTISPEGIQWKSTGLIKKGEFVGSPKEIKYKGKETLTKEEAYFLGLFVAEGTGNPLSITSFEPKIQTWLKKFIEKKFGYVPTQRKNNTITLFKKPTREYLHNLAKTCAATKHVPQEIIASNEETIQSFLAGYIEGDGCLGETVEMTTKSKILAHELTYLFTRNGILASINKKIVDGRKYYRLSITGNKNKKIIESIMENSIVKKKQISREINFSTKYGIPTFAIHPILMRTYKKLTGSRRRFNKWNKKTMLNSKLNTAFIAYIATKPKAERITQETLQQTQIFFKERLLEMGKAYETLKTPTEENIKTALSVLPYKTQEIYKKLKSKRSTFQNYITRKMPKNKTAQIARALQEMIKKTIKDAQLIKDLKTMEIIASQTIAWEKITKKTEKKYDGWVYDLSVPETKSFIGGNKPTWLHNSQWCFQTAVTVQLPKDQGGLEGGCLYIDSENSFRPERVIQISKKLGLEPEAVLKNIYVARAYNADHQMLLAEKAGEMVKENNIKLVIVDSLTAQFRAEYIGRGTLAERQQKLNKHMRTLQKLAEINNIALLVTNQVIENPAILFGDPTSPVGGNVVGHACVRGDTLVQLADGSIKEIREMNFPEKVISSNIGGDLRNAPDACSFKSNRNDIKKAYEIDSGHRIIASGEHRFFTLEGFEVKEKTAKEIRKGDYLAHAKNIAAQTQLQRIPAQQYEEVAIVNKLGSQLIKNFLNAEGISRKKQVEFLNITPRQFRRVLNQGYPTAKNNMLMLVEHGAGEELLENIESVETNKHKKLKRQEFFDEKIAQITGYFIGDGNAEERSVQFKDAHEEVLTRYQTLFKEAFNAEGTISKVNKKNCHKLSISCKELAKLFKHLKETGIGIAARSPNNVVAAFIRGFVDAEGHVDKKTRRISISQKSIKPLQCIQLLFKRFGINSRLRINTYKAGTKTNPVLELFSADVAKFAHAIGPLSSAEKQGLLEKWATSFDEAKAKTIVPLKRKDLAELLTKEFGETGRTLKKSGGQLVTVHELGRVRNALNEAEQLTTETEKAKQLINGLLDNDLHFEKVRNIREIPNSEPLYDVSVPSNENYIANGFIVHNSKTRLYLRKSKEDKRVAKLIDSPSLPDGEAIYRITENGIEDL